MCKTQNNEYNPPENKSEITNNGQICATTIKYTLNPRFYHIKYDGKYMPELFVTLPELPNKLNDQFFMILWLVWFLMILQKYIKTNHKFQNDQCTISRTSGMLPGLCKHCLIYCWLMLYNFWSYNSEFCSGER